MQDADCVAFLRQHLPRLGLRWAGFRKVRRTVCKRLQRRLAELGLADLAGYADYLGKEPGEWERLDAICRIPISRFYRDRAVFDCLGEEILPALAAAAASRRELRCWSLGCASGEEPYTVRLLWDARCQSRHPDIRCSIVATDADSVMIERARRACYGNGSLLDLPEDLRQAFVRQEGQWCLPAARRTGVTILLQDVRKEMPEGPFDLILCRNVVLTYLDSEVQRPLLPRLLERLLAGGAFVIGRHEALPPTDELAAWRASLGIFRRVPIARVVPPA